MNTSESSDKVTLFFSFFPANPDKNLFEQLRKHLSALRRQGLIDLLQDSEVNTGNNAQMTAIAQMNKADIILLLISSDFYASDQFADVEMPYAMKQQELRNARVIPILLRDFELGNSPLKKYSSLPPDWKPISRWRNLDQAFTEVTKGIHRIATDLVDHWKKSPKKLAPLQLPLFTIPHRRNPIFTNRRAVIQALHESFTSEQHPLQAVSGLSGVGKTHLVIEYAYHYQDIYDVVIWLNASSPEQFSADLRSRTEDLALPLNPGVSDTVRIEAINRWLQENDRWLLLIDNLNDLEPLHQILPTNYKGHVLVTTSSEMAEQFEHMVSIDQLTPEDGALLLLRRADIIPQNGDRTQASEADDNLALEISKELDYYPLALDQAGAHIKETGYKLSEYLQHYREQRTSLLSRRGQQAKDHPAPVATTLALTLERLTQRDPNALELLRFFAFLHPDGLPTEMLAYGAPILKGSLRTLAEQPMLLEETLATLDHFSLVHHRADSTTLTIPHITQVVLKQDLSQPQQLRLAKQAVLLINEIFPEVSSETWAACERFAIQAQHCTTLIHDYKLSLYEGPLLLERLGFYYYQRGSYQAARAVLTQALSLQELQPGTGPLKIAQTLNSLGLLASRQANYSEAETIHQRALEIRERLQDSQASESLHNLASLYKNNGQYQQAEQMYLRALTLDEQQLGPSDPEFATTLNALGVVYYFQNNYDQAMQIYRRALAIYEIPENIENPGITYVLNSIGTLYETQGQYQRAEGFYQQALEIRKQTLGERHSETARALNRIAHIRELQGNFAEAETLYQQARTISEEALGPIHPDVALFLNNLGLLAGKQHQDALAETLYKRSINIYERTLGAENSSINLVRQNLDQLYQKMRKEADSSQAQ